MKHIEVVAAKTHTPEYLLHKYWARKPHNVVAHFIRELVPEGGVVVDPFCGSGVVLHEAQKLGRQAYGFDVNPTACLISRVLAQPPETQAFVHAVTQILGQVASVVGESYCEDGKSIKYCVHAIIARCPECGCVHTQGEALSRAKSRYCKACGAKLRFNLEYLVDTEITAIAYDGDKELDTQKARLKSQREKSKQTLLDAPVERYVYPFAQNRRILAFDGMTTRHLFTPRNFSILCALSEAFWDIPDARVRDCALLFLTASAAQCSRLIANRNHLSTGGPAWSIPGFWVPAVHLETNPLVHFKARLKKFCRGLEVLNRESAAQPADIRKADARSGIDRLIGRGVHADLVFFDPPYGDNVPYLEFSSMWNSFLRDFPDPATDISVSDRQPRTVAWTKYGEDLHASVASIGALLKPEGRLLITFNNNDMRAWEALLKALQDNDFQCESVIYQIPAVVSSKAQKALQSSYISDIYSIYRKAEGSGENRSLSGVSAALVKCAKHRGGVISKSLAQRTMILAWLEGNISAALLSEMPAIQSSLFDECGGMLTLKGAALENPSMFAKTAREIAAEMLSHGPCEWPALYEKIATASVDYGIPDPYELRAVLEGAVTFHANRCIASLSADDPFQPL